MHLAEAVLIDKCRALEAFMKAEAAILPVLPQEVVIDEGSFGPAVLYMPPGIVRDACERLFLLLHNRNREPESQLPFKQGYHLKGNRGIYTSHRLTPCSTAEDPNTATQDHKGASLNGWLLTGGMCQWSARRCRASYV